MKILSTDVLVVGAGLGGFTAAVRASEQGAKVILIDKSGYAGGLMQAVVTGLLAGESAAQSALPN